MLITGASRGIGLEITRRFLEEGAQIVAISKNAERLRSAMEKLDPSGQHVMCLAEDLAEPAAPARIAATVAERWGALDVLFNNAGVQLDQGAKGFSDGNESTLTRSLDVNLKESGEAALALVTLPFEQTGKFWKNGKEIRF